MRVGNVKHRIQLVSPYKGWKALMQL